ncbi:MAG TPA: hypothetical protein VFY93_00550 [Planctomycetota bacterium]|nr:hypothetical protein [Planctomycetota bacterium]
MAEQICVCPQCGKKYKLKEGFDAKSFSCKSCGATVWVAGKPPAPAPTTKRAPAPGAAPSSRKAGRAAAARPARGGRRSRGREAPEQEEEGGRRGRGREKPKSSANILMAIGAVAVIGIVIVIALMSGKKDKGGAKQQPVAAQPGDESGGEGMSAAGGDASGAPTLPPGTEPAAATPEKTATPAAPANPEPTPTKPAEGEEAKPAEGGEGEESPSPEGGETPTKLGGGTKKTPEGAGKWDPPATLGHLDSTPPELRKQIDDLIAVLLDPQAGKEVHEAKAKLAAIGKPAFLPVLGKMAAIRDTITDNDTPEERLIESALMQGDGCLREMDGFLEASGKGIIRPGTDKKYIKYILILHYRRWLGGMPAGAIGLKDMPEMPGPFDPSKAPAAPDEEGDK